VGLTALNNARPHQRRQERRCQRSRRDDNFRAKVQEALEDTRPDVPEERVAAHFSARRAAARRRAGTES